MSADPAEQPRTSRRRRPVDEARREMLDAATRLLVDGGPDAVRVQVVARMVGVTDAGVHYHFGSREALLDAVLRDVARQLKADLAAVAAGWDDQGDVDLRRLLDELDDAYRRRDYARLIAWMRLRGWRPRGSGILRPHAEALHEARRRRAEQAGVPTPAMDDSLHLVVLLNLVAWAEALVGAEWRRGVGLPDTAESARAFQDWLVELLAAHLEPDVDPDPDPGPGPRPAAAHRSGRHGPT